MPKNKINYSASSGADPLPAIAHWRLAHVGLSARRSARRLSLSDTEVDRQVAATHRTPGSSRASNPEHRAAAWYVFIRNLLQVESIALLGEVDPDVSKLSDADLRRFYARLGGSVRSVRVGTGLSQADLAERIGFTRASVSNLEAGRQRITAHLLVQLAEALDVAPSRLLPGLSSQPERNVLEDLQQHIVRVPESAQHFVAGAVAQLAADQRREQRCARSE